MAPRMTVDQPVAVRGALAQHEQSRPSPMQVSRGTDLLEPHWWVLMCLHMCRGKGQGSNHRLQCELCDKFCHPACAARMNGEESAPDVMPVDGQEQKWRCPICSPAYNKGHEDGFEEGACGWALDLPSASKAARKEYICMWPGCEFHGTKDWRSKSHLDDHHMQHEPVLCEFCGVYKASSKKTQRTHANKCPEEIARLQHAQDEAEAESPVDGQ